MTFCATTIVGSQSHKEYGIQTNRGIKTQLFFYCDSQCLCGRVTVKAKEVKKLHLYEETRYEIFIILPQNK